MFDYIAELRATFAALPDPKSPKCRNRGEGWEDIKDGPNDAKVVELDDDDDDSKIEDTTSSRKPLKGGVSKESVENPTPKRLFSPGPSESKKRKVPPKKSPKDCEKDIEKKKENSSGSKKANTPDDDIQVNPGGAASGSGRNPRVAKLQLINTEIVELMQKIGWGPE